MHLFIPHENLAQRMCHEYTDKVSKKRKTWQKTVADTFIKSNKRNPLEFLINQKRKAKTFL